MKPGIYPDQEATKAAEAEYWTQHGYTFGVWQFRPETGEVVRNGWLLCRLTAIHAAMLQELISAHPGYVPLSHEGGKKIIWGLRRAIGRDAILAVRTWGYKFNPEAVL